MAKENNTPQELPTNGEGPKKKHAGGRPKEPIAQRVNKRIEVIRAKIDKSNPEEPILLDYEYLFRLVCRGLTNEQIAAVFEVAVMTVYTWKQSEEFSVCLKNSKELADDAMEQSLWSRGMGYTHEAVKMFQYEGSVIKEEYQEHYPPDTTAALAWLHNRRPDRWKRGINGEQVDPNRPLVVKVIHEHIGRNGRNGSTNGNGNGSEHSVSAEGK